jgi:hypothetical protein
MPHRVILLHADAPPKPAAWTRRLALRWIAAARGCDCSLEAT